MFWYAARTKMIVTIFNTSAMYQERRIKIVTINSFVAWDTNDLTIQDVTVKLPFIKINLPFYIRTGTSTEYKHADRH